MKRNSSCGQFYLGAFALLLGAICSVHAQWQTQSVILKPGWNAVYLHVDASHVSLDDLILVPDGAPISEVWLWRPAASTAQFTTSPQQSSLPNSQWVVWDSSTVVDSLTRLSGNGAYLVHNTGSVDYTWRIVGKPVAPRYEWTTSGLNFIGFPTPASSAPRWDAFLTPVPELQRSAEIYRYPGGDLGQNNPVRVWSPLFRTVNVRRGEAFWIRAGETYNRYFGPVSVDLQSSSGIHFSDTRGTYSVRLKNTTATAQTVTMDLLNSEVAPAGQTAITGTPPMLVRGALNTTNLTYHHSVLTNQQSFRLTAQGQPGSELEIVLGLNRSAMTAIPGSLYAGILRLADTGGLSQIDLPISAIVANTAGLWVGQATITHVGQYLTTYERGPDGQPLLAAITEAGAPYLATATNTSYGSVARPYPLRLILHNNQATNQVSLLQRVYFGLRAGVTTVATSENLLDPATLATARRVSAPHLPFALENTPWIQNSGELRLGTNVVFSVSLDHNDHASNPFLHTFHPDHDNLDPTFQRVNAQGEESYTVNRTITLRITAPAYDFSSLTTGTTTMGGDYSEVISFGGRAGQTREFTVYGAFSINRISPIERLTQP